MSGEMLTMPQVVAKINEELGEDALPVSASAITLNSWFPISGKRKARVQPVQNSTKTTYGYAIEFGDLENVERDQYEVHPQSATEVTSGEHDDVDNGQDGPPGDTHEPEDPNTDGEVKTGETDGGEPEGTEPEENVPGAGGTPSGS